MLLMLFEARQRDRLRKSLVASRGKFRDAARGKFWTLFEASFGTPLEACFGRCFRQVFEAVQGKFWTPYEESFGHCSWQVLDAV